MGIAPGLAHDVKRRLREIDPHLYPEWDTRRERWKIMYKRTGHTYQLMAVCDDAGNYRPIDERTYRHLRYLHWFNQQVIKNMWAMHNKEIEDNLKFERAEEQFAYDTALELRRPVQMLSREMGWSPGKTKLPYAPGFGDGKL